MVLDDAEEKARLEAENEAEGDQDAENDREGEDEVVDLEADGHMDDDEELGTEEQHNGDGEDKEQTVGEEDQKDEDKEKNTEETSSEIKQEEKPKEKKPFVKTTVTLSRLALKDLRIVTLQYVMRRCLSLSLHFNDEEDQLKMDGTLMMTFPYVEDAVDAVKRLESVQQKYQNILLDYPQSVQAVLAEEKAAREKARAEREKGEVRERSLYVNNIPPDTSEDLLKLMFPDCVKVVIPRGEDGSNMGCAVLEFKTIRGADDCLKNSKDVQIDDYKVTLRKIVTQKTKSDGGPSEKKAKGDEKREGDKKDNKEKSREKDKPRNDRGRDDRNRNRYSSNRRNVNNRNNLQERNRIRDRNLVRQRQQAVGIQQMMRMGMGMGMSGSPGFGLMGTNPMGSGMMNPSLMMGNMQALQNMDRGRDRRDDRDRRDTGMNRNRRNMNNRKRNREGMSQGSSRDSYW
ncbi:hypothetical protein ScPMuIL_004163 [Solemya velum]